MNLRKILKKKFTTTIQNNYQSSSLFFGLFGNPYFTSSTTIKIRSRNIIDSLSTKIKSFHSSTITPLNSNDYIDLMDEISNELCILIDGSSAISLLYEDKSFKEAADEVISLVSNYMEDLNKDLVLFENLKLIKAYANDGKVDLSNEKKVLIDKMIFELGLISKENQFSQENIIKPDYIHGLFSSLNEDKEIKDFLIKESEIKRISSVSLRSYLLVIVNDNEKVNCLYEENSNDKHFIVYRSSPELMYLLIKSCHEVIELKERALKAIQDLSNERLKYFIEIINVRLRASKVLLNNEKASFARHQLMLMTKKVCSKQLINVIYRLNQRLIPNILYEFKKLYDFNKSERLITNNTLLTYHGIKYMIDKFNEDMLVKASISPSTSSNIISSVDDTVMSKASKTYITIQNILNGMIILSKELFNIELEFILDEDQINEMMLHKSVLKCIVRRSISPINDSSPKTFDVNSPSFIYKDKNFIDLSSLGIYDKLGTIYFDFFIRDGKDKSTFSHITIQGSKQLNLDLGKERIRQKPISIIATNLEVTSLDLMNMPVSFNECKDIFHEFGHSMHSILSETQLQSLSGTRIGMDYAEVPSNIFEKYIYDYDFCRKWMIDRNYNMEIPYELHYVLSKGSVDFEVTCLSDVISNSLIDLKVHSFESEDEINEKTIKNIFKRENSNFIYTIPTEDIDDLLIKFTQIYSDESVYLNKSYAYVMFIYEFNMLGLNSVEKDSLADMIGVYSKDDMLLIEKKREDLENIINGLRKVDNHSSLTDEGFFIFNSHLIDYPSSYYSYIIGKVYSNIIWEQFKSKGNKNIFDFVYKELLSKGGCFSSEEFSRGVFRI